MDDREGREEAPLGADVRLKLGGGEKVPRLVVDYQGVVGGVWSGENRVRGWLENDQALVRQVDLGRRPSQFGGGFPVAVVPRPDRDPRSLDSPRWSQ